MKWQKRLASNTWLSWEVWEERVRQVDDKFSLVTILYLIFVVIFSPNTDPTNFLNAVGKNADGSGNGDILLWKRKAEKHLVNSGLFYTIIHPGGLTDTPPGEEDFVIDVDDKLLNNKKRSISRADVANLCVAALSIGKGKKVALDCITQSRDDDEPVKTAEAALEMFLQQSKVYDYAL